MVVCSKVIRTLSDMDSFSSFPRLYNNPYALHSNRFTRTENAEKSFTTVDPIEAQVSLLEEKIVLQGNIAALRTADEMTGTLLDTFA